MAIVGIDIGGMSIKLGIVSIEGKILEKINFKVDYKKLSSDQVIEMIKDHILMLLDKSKFSKNDLEGIGIGCPGAINAPKGVVDYANNLGWVKVPLVAKLKEYFNVPIYISNDANVAALGEAIYGSGKQYNNSVMITLGTGVGGGIVIDHRLFEGNEGKGAELGHMVIEVDGKECSCGRRGCFEAYSSATALIESTKKAMIENQTSQMWQEVAGNLDKVDGKLAFEYYKKGDLVAKEVIDNYIHYLGEGLLNICNIFRPEAILLGGGISAQKDCLLNLLEPYLEERFYGYRQSPKVALKIATLGNDAGIIGAAALVLQNAIVK